MASLGLTGLSSMQVGQQITRNALAARYTCPKDHWHTLRGLDEFPCEFLFPHAETTTMESPFTYE